MMKEEFEQLIGEEVDQEEYKVIEFVYMWYPAIDEEKGKQQIADLYQILGMPGINDLYPRAKMIYDIHGKIIEHRQTIGRLEKLERELSENPQIELSEDERKLVYGLEKTIE